MFRPRHPAFHCSDSQLTPLPASFRVLVWNVHKLPLPDLLACPRPQADLWLLQEACLHKEDTPPWACWQLSPNLRWRHRHCGVLTASSLAFESGLPLLSQHRELRWLTRKSALLSRHLLANGQVLKVLNVHMLLTASRHRVVQELARFSPLLEEDGPLIVAGDFNTWSRPRLQLLAQWAEAHRLVWPVPDQAHHVRHHRRRPLDHLLYRGLRLEVFEALSSPCSDHNPLVAQFVP